MQNCRNDFQSNKKTTTCTCETENDLTIDDIFISPGEEEVIEIMTRVETNTSCQAPDYSWTSWYSATNDNINDYETLLDHRNLNKYGSYRLNHLTVPFNGTLNHVMVFTV